MRKSRDKPGVTLVYRYTLQGEVTPVDSVVTTVSADQSFDQLFLAV